MKVGTLNVFVTFIHCCSYCSGYNIIKIYNLSNSKILFITIISNLSLTDVIIINEINKT